MIIDFHTHVFPDKIAEKTVNALEKSGGSMAHTNGTLQQLRESMAQSGVDLSVVMPVMTRPSQFNTVNAFAAELNKLDGILSFGGFHPDTDDYKRDLDAVKALGLKGVKIHPDYQDCMIDDPRYVNMIRYAVENDLMVLTHAGIDPGFPDLVHCPPDRGAAMLEMVYGDTVPEQPKIIFAHTGGWGRMDDMEKYLFGKPIYMDISFVIRLMPPEDMLHIIRGHGADRILFASDSPWGGQQQTLDLLRNLPLTEEEMDLILYKNAKKLLGME